MLHILISIIAGLVFGSVVAFINSRITKKLLLDDTDSLTAQKHGSARVMLVNMIRLLISAAALFLVFILRNILPFNFIAAIAGTAGGLTFVSYYFLWRLVRDYRK